MTLEHHPLTVEQARDLLSRAETAREDSRIRYEQARQQIAAAIEAAPNRQQRRTLEARLRLLDEQWERATAKAERDFAPMRAACEAMLRPAGD